MNIEHKHGEEYIYTSGSIKFYIKMYVYILVIMLFSKPVLKKIQPAYKHIIKITSIYMLFVYMVHTNFIIIKFVKKSQKNIAISMFVRSFHLRYICILTTIGI